MGIFRSAAPTVRTAALLLCFAVPILGQSLQPSMDQERRLARHFPERPPVQFEVEQNSEHGPRIIITNLHQYPLTAFVVQTQPQSANDAPQTLIIDALTRVGGLAPIPRGLSYTMSVPHVVGGLVPDAKLVAAVWDDGSTYGPDDLLARISNARKILADSYDRAIVVLRTGLEKNWSAEQYLSAAQELRPMNPTKTALTVEEARTTSEALVAGTLPSRTIDANMQHEIRGNRPLASVARAAQVLLKSFEQSRDSLRQALSASVDSAKAVSTN